MNRLGLVGGTSWVSSERYYRVLNEGVASRLGGSHSAPVTLWSVEFGELARLQHEDDWAGVARILADAGRRLVDAGCAGIALAANTTHLVADEVRAAIGDAPLIDLVDLTVDAVAGYRTVGMLGTQFTMSSPMFPDRFAARGVQTLLPSTNDQQRVHEVIYDELTRGVVSETARRDYLDVIAKLVADGAEAVVLACTEQGLLMRDGGAAVSELASEHVSSAPPAYFPAPVPLLDTTDIHCRGLLDFILGEPIR